MSEKTLGPFLIEGRLGTGGMGIVYRATYKKNGRKVALKVLSPNVVSNKKILARFEREMTILEKLKHPGIVRYFGGAKQGSQRFFAMELMDGGALDDELKRLGTLPWERVVDVASQTCEALQYAHAAGVIHRDLKPGNLFTTKKGRVKLGDFGIARDTDATALTEAGKTVGTYAYMAPEQITGKPAVSHKTDLYALGCVMFEMLTGKPPFVANTPAEMLYMHIQEDPPRIRHLAPECPVWLEALVHRLMAKDVGDRPYDALATKGALDEVLAKVAANVSVSGATAAGGPTQLTVGEVDTAEVRQMVRKKRKKKKGPAGPFWESTWFLGACLGVIVLVAGWAMWPASEEQLYASAVELWAPIETQIDAGAESLEGTYDARRAIERLIDRYPEGTHAEEAKLWLADLDGYRLERESITLASRNGTPKSEAQRLFIDAYGYEQFGDRVTALAKYRAMRELLRNREEDQPYVAIASKHIRLIEEAGGTDEDRVSIVQAELDRADELGEAGHLIPARRIWNSIVTLYSLEPELATQVEHAREQLEKSRPM